MPIRSRATKARPKNPHAVALSALGASKGGKARAAKLSKQELSDQGRKAVQARWAKHRAEKKKKEKTRQANRPPSWIRAVITNPDYVASQKKES